MEDKPHFQKKRRDMVNRLRDLGIRNDSVLAALEKVPRHFFVSPAFMALSRRFERESDKFARNAMNSPKPLVNALRKMAMDNLSNLCPHSLYVKFNYSHPPITERIKNLESM